MTCEQASAKLDMGEIPEALGARLWFELHFVHCRNCRAYRRLTYVLHERMRDYAAGFTPSLNAERLTQDLLKKHAQT